MKAAIERIIIKERIRKDIKKISELAADIEKNGLINPVTVMELDGGMFQLLAGLRRIKAMQSIGLTEIEVNIVSPTNAEATLYIEISENEQREDFTFSEKMDYAGLLDVIETEKAKERQIESGINYGRGGQLKVENRGSQPLQKRNPQVRDIVGGKINMSGVQYERAKYVAEKASPEVIEQLDKGERTIRGTYNELKAKEESANPPVIDDSDEADDDLPEIAPVSESVAQSESPSKSKNESHTTTRTKPATEEEQMKYLSEKDKEGVRKLSAFDALLPEGKISELQRQLREERARAATAESELAMLRERYGIDVDHKDSIIESLKRQNAELSIALTAAQTRIAELEKSN